MNALEKHLSSLQSKTGEMDAIAKNLDWELDQLAVEQRVREEDSGKATSQLRDLSAKVAVLQGNVTRDEERIRIAAADSRRIEGAFQGLRSSVQARQADLESIATRIAATNGVLTEVRAGVAELQEQVAASGERFQRIERVLQRAHYVFKANVDNSVWGMGLFMRFRTWENSPAKSGVSDLCISSAPVGRSYERQACQLWGPGLLKFGEEAKFEANGYRYSVILRHYISIPILHDQVGFDISKEPLAPQ